MNLDKLLTECRVLCEATKQTPYVIAQRIVKNKTAERGIDLTSANTFIQVYNKLNDANKAKLDAMDPKKAMSIVWKAVGNRSQKNESIERVNKLLDEQPNPKWGEKITPPSHNRAKGEEPKWFTNKPEALKYAERVNGKVANANGKFYVYTEETSK